ncbi:hypothetical protein VNI00_014626 [Paramarasmius palmivorus]|uniref:Thioesterase domain-containing protein n=1 Tax=Paramarasmius palmivorus TaxID=297713 RepID=A0AAW0BTN7_9AGAR
MISSRSDISRISGNASDHVKAFLADPTTLEDVSGQSQLVRGFGYDIISRMVVTEVSLNKKQDEPLREEGRVVIKMKVEQGTKVVNVSLALNIAYHAPAGLGEDLRIVSTTLTVGGRAFSARTEMWSETHHRLVASGVHIKLTPSTPGVPKL